MNPPDSFTPERNDPAQPWWRVGMVWLVIGGPLVVVVASLIQGRNHAASPKQ